MIFLTHVVGWTLLSFVWQGAVVGLAAAAFLRSLHAASPQVRYGVACAALAAMLMAPAVTAYQVFRSEPHSSLTTESRLVIPVGGLTAPSMAVLTPSATPSRGVSMQTVALALDETLPTIVAVWMTGVALLIIRLVGGWFRVRRLHRAALAAPASSWQGATDRIAGRLLLNKPVRTVDSFSVAAPMVLGWVRPVVLLPIAMLSNLSMAQTEAILAHELAHIRRHDYAVNLLQTISETLLFYHPAVWWVSARIRAEREQCCDVVAVDVCGDAVAYAEALAELESLRADHGSSFAVAATGGSLLDRVRRLLQGPPERGRSSAVLIPMAALALVVAGTPHLPAFQAPSPNAPHFHAVGDVTLPQTATVRGDVLASRPPDTGVAAQATSAEVRSMVQPPNDASATLRLRARAAFQVLPRISEDESAVMAVDDAFRLAKLHNDIAALGEILHQDFVETNQNGRTYTRADAIESWRTFKMDSLTTDQAAVRVVGNTAIVSGHQTELNGSGTDRMQFSRTYVKNGASWQLLESMQARDFLPQPFQMPKSMDLQQQYQKWNSSIRTCYSFDTIWISEISDDRRQPSGDSCSLTSDAITITM